MLEQLLVRKNMATFKYASHNYLATRGSGHALLVGKLANSLHFRALLKVPPDVGSNLVEEDSPGGGELRCKRE